jgi:hypothetical protein
MGFSSDAPNELFEFKEKIPGKRNGAGYLDPLVGNYIKDTAKQYYDRVKKVVEFELRFDDKEMTLDGLRSARIAAGIRAEGFILSTQSENNRYLILNEFRKLLATGVRNGSDVIVSSVLRAAIGGEYSPDTEGLLNSLRNSKFMNEQQIAETDKMLNHLIEANGEGEDF